MCPVTYGLLSKHARQVLRETRNVTVTCVVFVFRAARGRQGWARQARQARPSTSCQSVHVMAAVVLVMD